MADALVLSDHAVDRFRRRADRPAHLSDEELRAELADRIRKSGVPKAKPPKWVHIGPPPSPGTFYVILDGGYVLPAVPRLQPGSSGVHYIVTTVLAHGLTAADLAELTGHDLAARMFVPRRVVEAWWQRAPRGTRAASAEDWREAASLLRETIIVGGRAQPTPPDWAGTKSPVPGRFYVCLDDRSALVVLRAERGEGHGRAFRAIAVVRDVAGRPR